MRVSVVKFLKQRKRDTTKKYNNGNNTINFNTFRSSRHTRHKAGRLCGDLEIFQKHFLTKGDLKNPKACEVCVIDSYTKYGLYRASVHYFSEIWTKNQNFFVNLHSDKFIWLTKKDVDLIGRIKIIGKRQQLNFLIKTREKLG